METSEQEKLNATEGTSPNQVFGEEEFAEMDETTYEVTSYRWVIEALFAMQIFNSSMMVIWCSTIAVPVSHAFGVSIAWVNMCALANNVLFVPMTVLGTYLYKNKKRHHVMILGCIF